MADLTPEQVEAREALVTIGAISRKIRENPGYTPAQVDRWLGKIKDTLAKRGL